MTRLIAFATFLLAMAAAEASPAEDRSGKPHTGAASFYSAHDAGKPTASGEPLALNKMTAASPNLPLGTKAEVTNKATGKAVQVTVTDRGPYAKGRVLDVTPKAAERLGMLKDGIAPVEVKPVKLPLPAASH